MPSFKTLLTFETNGPHLHMPLLFKNIVTRGSAIDLLQLNPHPSLMGFLSSNLQPYWASCSLGRPLATVGALFSKPKPFMGVLLCFSPHPAFAGVPILTGYKLNSRVPIGPQQPGPNRGLNYYIFLLPLSISIWIRPIRLIKWLAVYKFDKKHILDHQPIFYELRSNILYTYLVFPKFLTYAWCNANWIPNWRRSTHCLARFDH